MTALRIGELLTSKGCLTKEQLDVALSQQAITGELLGDTLIKLGFVSSKEMARILSEQSGIEFLDIEQFAVSEDALRMVSHDMAESMGFLPLSIDDGTLSIGVTDPTNIRAMDMAARISGKPPRVFIIDAEGFREALESAYYFLENPIGQRISETVGRLRSSDQVPVSAISELAELLIINGIRRKSTDMHISPSSDAVHVFYRIDGVLQHSYCLPKGIHSGIVSRLKILSELDIAEQRLPQDGSFTYRLLDRPYEMRLSVVPTIYGENVVIRILGGSTSLLSVADLGFDAEDTAKLRRMFSKPHGMILVVGPTGSGKTTTLYAALREVNLIAKNVLTVEDPVEYKLSMVRQTKISEKAGYDFALAGRSFMRQDPDVILLGEIRDGETARIAIRASITGHLVLSTLHTNDAVTTVPRLIDLDADRFLLSSSLLAVIAQRLVRTICPSCREELDPGEEDDRTFELLDMEQRPQKVYRGRGCRHCSGRGYLGRTAIGEIMIVSDSVRELIYSGASVGRIHETVVAEGMTTLKENAVRKALDGVTTFEEVLRVAG
ncbi:MAG TPA: type II/IV secretion system protein [Deltaproteobacteria bacterium]|nr:type II/IV secretion system protein [Deltaproteobacteria bacterium]